MKRYVIALILLSSVAIAYAQRGEPAQAPAGGGRGRGLSPEQQAALAAQTELEKNTPQIPYDAVSLPLMPDGHTIGETEGVALNSKKHLFVYTRSGNAGPARGAQAAELFEFDQANKFVKEWGQNSLRLLLRPCRPRRQGRQRLGGRRRLEHGDEVQPAGAGHAWCSAARTKRSTTSRNSSKKARTTSVARPPSPAPAPAGRGTFGRPTDVTWDTQGNIFVSDGYDNSRVAKFTKDGDFVKSIGSRGTAPGSVQHAARDHVRRQGQHLRRRSRQQPHPGLRPGPEPQGDLQQRARAVGGLHHPAERAGPAVPLQRRRRRQDLQAGSRRQAARLVRNDRQEGRPVLLGRTRCTASARTRSTRARRRTGASST